MGKTGRTLLQEQHLASRLCVCKAHRRSIADAYAAHVGIVDHLPEDTYGLALYALDRACSSPAGAWPGRSLPVSPFVTTKAKHAAICNAAQKIMAGLDGFEHKVLPWCPQELRQLCGRKPRAAEPYPPVATCAAHRAPGGHASAAPGPACHSARGGAGRQPARAHPAGAAATATAGRPSSVHPAAAGVASAAPATHACRSGRPDIATQVVTAAALDKAKERASQPSPQAQRPSPSGSGSSPAGAAARLLPPSRHIAAHLRVAEYYRREARPFSAPSCHLGSHPAAHSQSSAGTAQGPHGSGSKSASELGAAQEAGVSAGQLALGYKVLGAAAPPDKPNGHHVAGPTEGRDSYPYRLPASGGHGHADSAELPPAALLMLIQQHKEQQQQQQHVATAPGSCGAGRSRRLVPTDADVAMSRQLGVPIIALMEQSESAPQSLQAGNVMCRPESKHPAGPAAAGTNVPSRGDGPLGVAGSHGHGHTTTTVEAR